MTNAEIELLASKCLLQINKLGIEIEIVKDFERVPQLMAELGKSPGVANDPGKTLMTRANSLWVFARRDGQLVAGWGVRVDECGDEDAQSFLARSVALLFDVQVTGCSSDVLSGQFWGRAAYFGDLTANFNHAGGLGSSGRRIIRLLAAYMHHRVFTDLRAHVSYCFLRGTDVHKGIHYGFLHPEPFVWETDKTMYVDGNPEWVMCLPKIKLASVMAAAANLLD